MTNKNLLRGMGNIDTELVLDAAPAPEGKKKAKITWLRWAACAAAVFVLFLGGIGGTRFYQTNYQVDSVVSLDVNPSIEITTNQKCRVLSVEALNEDGKIVIGDMSFKGTQLDVTVNALIGSMLRNGYINECANSILVSVSSDDSEKSAALQEKLVEEINAILQTESISGAVLSQEVSPNDDLKALADSYGVSLGKAQLIEELISQNESYSFEELSALTINELNLLRKSKDIELENVTSTGVASDKSYIGKEKAKEIAFTNAGVTAEGDASKVDIELDYENGAMVYEVSFIYGGYEYDYDINAVTGEIASLEKEPAEYWKDESEKNVTGNDPASSEEGSGQTSTTGTGAYIGEEEAKEIAFANAGVTDEGSVSKIKIELDKEHGVMIYEVKFVFGSYEYDYDIDATTGVITKAETEPVDDKDGEKTTSGDTDDENNIGKERARQIAISQAGVSEEDIRDYKCDMYYKDGVKVFKIKFIANGYEYSCDIDAVTGDVVKYDCQPEYDD